MSLMRTVLRMCAVAALRSANTLAEDRVYDSDNTPLVDALQTQQEPYITVYTDDDPRINIDGKEIYASERSMSLIIEIGVASATQAGEIKIPATDEGMELAIDILETQSLAALFGEVHNPWSEFVRSIVMKVTRVGSVRAGSAQQGTRWAARQVTFSCDVISDLPPGVVPKSTHVWNKFVEFALNQSPANPKMQAAAMLIQTVMNSSEYPTWRQIQAWMTITEEGVRAIGVAPVIEQADMTQPDETPPELQKGYIEDEDTDQKLSEDDFEPGSI